MLSNRCLSVCPVCLACPVCNVGVLWPNCWTNQDETCQASRPLPWPHCVRWEPSSPPKLAEPPNFSAHICCGQMAGWSKMPLGREVGLGPTDIVLDGDPALPPTKRGHSPPHFWPMSAVAKRLDGSRGHLVWRYSSARSHYVR